jgi:AcrR family transcriptional regulator
MHIYHHENNVAPKQPHLGRGVRDSQRRIALQMKISSQLQERDTPRIIVESAERLFSQVGFQKTTVADIARELRMSPANIYRFFSAKAEINEAVGRRLLSEVEAAVDDVVKTSGPASEKLRACIAAIEKANARRFAFNRKLQELLETAFNENWGIVREHVQNLDQSLAEIISQGNRDGEFHVEDCEREAILVRGACVQFCHPWFTVDCAEAPEPTVDEMVDFCLAALVQGSYNVARSMSSEPRRFVR